jgi:S-DNA-T family DNA segregation ATPase FtsK/SpoIIIE
MITQELNVFLKNFKIKAYCQNISENSLSRIYDFSLLPGAKVKDLQKHSAEITMFLKEVSEPTIKIIYEENMIKFEYLKIDRKIINFWQDLPKDIDNKLSCFLGKDLSGRDIFLDIASSPHVLISGSTGSGKSTLINVIISNLLRNNVQTFLVDLKGIDFFEYAIFDNITLYNSYDGALSIIKYLYDKMNCIYNSILSGAIKRNEFEPSVLIIDEFADLIMHDLTGELNRDLLRLIQKCRAASIHVILATQRPSADILTGNIKANMPVRIACRTSSSINSRIILESIGAEKLLGRGDALIRDHQGNINRFQSAYTSPEEAIKNLILRG